MNRKISFALFCTLSILFIFSCKKKEEDPVSATSTLSIINDGLKPTPQNFTVTAGQDQTIIAADSTIIRFYPNSFKDASGSIITSGQISIQLTEMRKPGQMIANNASTTTTDGQTLQSGGQVYIKAVRSNNETVYANKYSIRFKQTRASGLSMELYYGESDNSGSSVTWVSGANGTGTVASGTDSGVVFKSFYYVFDSCTHFNWVNCDRNIGGATAPFTVTIPRLSETLEGYNSKFFIAYPEYNVVVNAWNGKLSFNREMNTVSIVAKAPVGTPYKMYFIGYKDGKYYYDEKSGIITESFTINPVLGEETIYDIKARLGAL